MGGGANGAGQNTQTFGKTVTITNSGAKLLSASKTFAVCYSKQSSTSNELWRDTYIRLKISKITALVTADVSHRTYGQIPNVFSEPANGGGLKFHYVGTLQAGKYLSLVDQTLNNNLPCNQKSDGTGSEAGRIPATVGDAAQAAWSQRVTHSGAKQAGPGLTYVQTFNTHHLDTSKVFALCYTDGTGAMTDVNWADSGIRLTVTKIHNFILAREGR